jgi:hypothetical protein
MRSRTIGVALFLVATFALPASAQLNTQHIKGAVGLKGGSVPPPHWYVVAPLVYTYNTDTVRDRDGNKIPVNADITVALFGTGVTRITTKKFLGGNYGFSAVVAGVNNRLQAAEIEFDPGGGLTDMVVQPVILGWSFKRADVMASYTMYLPTGRYNRGGSDNLGFGMWGHEPAVGTTVYLNASRQFHAATVASVTFQSNKEDSDTHVGTAMNLEGGVGADFLKGGLTTGLVYYTSFKLQSDRIDVVPDIPGTIVGGKNKVFAFGPEVSLAIAAKGTIFAFLKVNYQWEVFAKTNTQGNALILTLSLPVKPIKLPAP